MKPQLTPKQKRFCPVYLETGNASEAYRTAYNTDRMKPETINRKAKELFKNGPITALISELQSELKETSDIKKRRVLFELEAILEAKITDYMDVKQIPVVVGQDEEGNDITVLKTSLALKDFNTLTEAQRRAVESVKQTKYGFDLKLHGKSWAIERICKMLGYEAPSKLDLSSNGEQVRGYVMILPSNGREVIKEDPEEQG